MQANGSPPPQIRSKELTDRQIKNLKTTLQRLQLPGLYDIYYCIGAKDSNTGLFSNDRLVILNTKERSVGYISKLPPGLIPFLNEDEVRTLKFKSKVSRQEILNNQIKEFRCYPLPGKVSTFQVFFKKGNKNQIQKWDFQMGNFNLMNEWINLINNTILFYDDKPKPPQKPVQYQPPLSPRQPITQSKKILNQKPVQPMPVNQSLPPPPPPLATTNSKVHITNLSYDEPQINSSRIANMPFNDHVSQLKYLRKENPNMFNTTNQLSKKNLPPYEQNLLQNNKNTVNATNEVNLNFSKKPGREDFVSEKQYEDTAFYRQKDLSRQTLQNSQVNIEGYKKTRSGLSPIQKDISPTILNQNEYKRYNSQHQNAGNGEQTIFPLSNPKEGSRISRQQDQRQLDFNKVNSRSIMNQNEEMQNSNAKKNITIDNRNRQIGSITVNEPLKGNSRLNESNLSKSNLVKKDFNIVSSKSINNNSFRGLHRKRWNQIFAETNDKLQIYQQFIHSSFNIVRQIINQMALDQNQKDYIPIQIKPPYFTFYTEGIIIILHYFQNGKNINSSTYNQNTPLLYDQSSYQQLKRQFYHYNTILSVTSNEGFIKVPLSSYFQYKGVIAFCKAEIPQNFSQVTPKRYEKQFDIIQNQIHLRFMFGSFNTYLHPNSKYIILDNMKELIPQIPLQKNEGHFFRKQFLLSYQHIIEDIQDSNEANDFITHRVVPEALGKLQSLQTYLVNSTDFFRYMHDEGLSFAYLPLLIQQTKSSFLKRLFMSELVSIVFSAIFRSQINNLYKSFPVNDYEEVTLDLINNIIIDSTHALLQMMFSYSNNAQKLWKIIVEQCRTKYRVVISKQDLIGGYLLSSIAQRIGIVLDFRKSSFDKHQVQFFAKPGNIPRDMLVGFKLKIRRYDLSSISGKIQTVQNILYSDPTSENFNVLVNTLNLKQQPIPNYLENLEQTILTYLCNFVPYSQHQEFQNIGIYNMVLLEPHSLNSTKCSLLAIKWCIKKKFVDEALKIYEMKQIQNAFWLGQYNPAISEFYDFFSMYYASVGRYDQSIQLAKLSLKNIMKVVGVAELPVADKHYQLGNIYFKMGRKEDSLKQYTLTKDILLSHQQTNIAQYAIILLKLSVLYLNFGKINEAVNQSLQALKIFENTLGSEQDQIGTFEVLSRCYQITKKQKQLQNVGQLAAQKFNQTEDYLIFQRMAKLVLYIKLKNLSSAQAKAFLAILSKLQEQAQDINQLEAFSFLHKKCLSENLMRKVEHYLQNIVYLYEEASKKDLFRRYKSLDQNTKHQAEQMLVILEALGIFIGFGYLIGSLRENYE